MTNQGWLEQGLALFRLIGSAGRRPGQAQPRSTTVPLNDIRLLDDIGLTPGEALRGCLDRDGRNTRRPCVAETGLTAPGTVRWQRAPAAGLRLTWQANDSGPWQRLPGAGPAICLAVGK